jgi:pseudouridine-5'-monophosphatase
MDGLLLDTEDRYTYCQNQILAKYNRPSLPWSIKAKLQGRPGPASTKLFHDWAQLPISLEEYKEEYYALQAQVFPDTQPLAGVPGLLRNLSRTRYWDSHRQQSTTNGTSNVRPPHRVHIALATSAHESNFHLKTSHLESLFSVFEPHRRVLGDDPRIPPGRGKPMPDIYLVALQTINNSLPPGEPPITPEECLVFEDSVPGVEAGRRAGMRVVWVPHPMLKKEYAGREALVLAGRTGDGAGMVDAHQLGEVDDGWAEYMESLVDFPYEKYGIVVPPEEVERQDAMMVDGRRVEDGEVVQVVESRPAPRWAGRLRPRRSPPPGDSKRLRPRRSPSPGSSGFCCVKFRLRQRNPRK